METRISDQTLENLSHFVTENMGLYFPKNRWEELTRGLRSAAKHFNFSDLEECAQWLMSAPMSKIQIETLASYLTIGETYFYREAETFRILEEQILPELLRQQKPEQKIKIWSAGCASGEEPYSIAIAIDRVIPEAKYRFAKILATDINLNFLKRTSEGIYSEWSFRNAPPWLKRKYFKERNGKYEILSEFKESVEPYYLNLVEDVYPLADLIFCRNVLMYFSQSLIEKVVNKFHDCLSEGGFLVVGLSEAMADYYPQFKQEKMDHISVFKKITIKKSEIYQAKAPVLKPYKRKLEISYPKENKVIEVKHYEELFQQAKQLADQGQSNQALQICLQALEQNKIDFKLHFLYANILIDLGEYIRAEKALKDVLFLQPDFISAYISLSNLYRLKNRLNLANKYLDTALVLLSKLDNEQVLPETGGLTVENMMQWIKVMRQKS